MTTDVEATNAIYTRFIDNWSSTPFTFENEAFDLATQVPAGDSWVRLSVDELSSNQETLGNVGNRKYKRLGIAVLQIFTPKDTGVTDSSGSRTLISEFRALFEGIRLGSLIFFDVTWSKIDEDGSYIQTNSEVVFMYEEIK